MNIKIMILIYILIFQINNVFAINGTPKCTKSIPSLDTKCDNSCIAPSPDFAASILYLFDPVYQALDRQFDMIGAEASRDIGSLRGIKNIIQTTAINGGGMSYNYLTDNDGNICQGTNNPSQICTKAAPNPVDGCTIKANNIMFNIRNLISVNPSNTFNQNPGDFVRVGFTDGGIAYFTVLKIIQNADMICVQTPFSFLGPLLYFAFGLLQPNDPAIFWYNLGCRYIDIPVAPPFNTPVYNSVAQQASQGASTPNYSTASNCLANSACNGNSHSQNKILKMTAVSVECITQAIEAVFVSGCSGSTGYINILSNFQTQMQEAVSGALVLYVVIFGIRMLLGQEMPNKGELLMFVMKLILVIYFSIGLPAGSPANSDLSGSTNGVQDIIIPGFNAISKTISAFTFSNLSSGLCDFSNAPYDQGYEYLSLWDSFDCRLAYYLGFITTNNEGKIQQVFSIIFLVSIVTIFFGYIFLGILLILFAAFLISMVVFLVNFFVISLVGLMITSYFAPLFVPLALFKVTKGYFDAWLRLLFGFALQPIIITAFMSILMGAIDQSLFTDCHWNQNHGYWVLESPSTTCKNSMGSMIFFNTGATKNININFFNIIVFPAAILDPLLLIPLITLVLSLFLFYHFAQNIGGFVAEIIGAPNLQRFTAIGITAPLDMLMQRATKGAFKSFSNTGEGKIKRD